MLARSVTAQGGTVPSVNVPTANGTAGPVALEGFQTPFAGYGIWNAADFMTLNLPKDFSKYKCLTENQYMKQMTID